MIGVVYVAFGQNAIRCAGYSIASLRRFHDWPITVLTDGRIKAPGVEHIGFDEPMWGARWAKLNINNSIRYDSYLYLDADTRVNGDLSAGWEILADGWDAAMSFSSQQGDRCLWHIDGEERAITYEELGNPLPLAMQGGMMFANRERVDGLFRCWQQEWYRYRTYDQAALLRALHRNPVRLWVLGRDWNGGALVTHQFGRARA